MYICMSCTSFQLSAYCPVLNSTMQSVWHVSCTICYHLCVINHIPKGLLIFVILVSYTFIVIPDCSCIYSPEYDGKTKRRGVVRRQSRNLWRSFCDYISYLSIDVVNCLISFSFLFLFLILNSCILTNQF